MNLICLVVFILATLANLYGNYVGHQKFRTFSKPLLLLSLLGYYLSSTSTLSLVISLAILTSWLGDVLLMPSHPMWFIIGGSSFAISLVLYTYTF